MRDQTCVDEPCGSGVDLQRCLFGRNIAIAGCELDEFRGGAWFFESHPESCCATCQFVHEAVAQDDARI